MLPVPTNRRKMLNRNTDPIYNFFCTQINSAEFEVRRLKQQLRILANQQTAAKRGKAYLVKLRREYVESKEPKTKKRRENTMEGREKLNTTGQRVLAGTLDC